MFLSQLTVINRNILYSKFYICQARTFCGYFSKIKRLFLLTIMSDNGVSKNDENKITESMPEIYKLNKSKFNKTLVVPSVRVRSENVSAISKSLKECLLHMRKVKNVVDTEEPTHKILLLNPDKFLNESCVSEEVKLKFDKYKIDLSSWSIKELQITYDNLSFDDVLKDVLPSDIDGFGGFSNIGHIVHVNLKENLLPYKYLIGEVLLDKVSTARTVVNKTNTIDNTYRTFAMELIAGEPDYIVTCREHGVTFKFDFSKVYWNPRLATEHQRVISLLQNNDVIYDVFAGVGPFAIPAAKKGCKVISNDLNPDSCHWLRCNAQLNKVNDRVTVYELDGRVFITDVLKPSLESLWLGTSECYGAIHVIMNLPALAVEFLDAFRGLLHPSIKDSMKGCILPTVHCYTFSRDEDPETGAKLAVEQALGCLLPPGHIVRRVRNVAPNKDMICVTFQLPEEVLLRGDSANCFTKNCANVPSSDVLENIYQEPEIKKPKISHETQ